MKRVAILGSTGSIGVNALNVIREMPDLLSVFGLSAHSNSALVAEQAKEFGAVAVTMFDPKAGADLKTRLNGKAKHLAPGVEGLCDLASHPDVDVVLTSVVGGVGFAPLLAAIRAGKIIALANKEPMVMAGAQFMREAERWNAKIVPVDSEPSAIFQCVQGLNPDPRAAAPLKTISFSSARLTTPSAPGNHSPTPLFTRKAAIAPRAMKASCSAFTSTEPIPNGWPAPREPRANRAKAAT